MKYIYIVISFFSLLGCVGRNTNGVQSNDLIVIPISSKAYLPFDLSVLSNETFYVKLATEDSCLVGQIDKMCYVNDHIIIGSDNNTLLFFNKDGAFDHKICRQGDGPNEYIHISDFSVDGKKNIVSILDTRKKQLLQYDWYGNFVGATSLDYWVIGFQPLNDSINILYSGNQISTDNKYKLALYDSYSHIISDRFYPISPMKSDYLHMHSANNFSRYGNEVLFCELYNDTIYSVSSSGCVPLYYIDFGDKKVPSSFYENKFDNIMEFQNKFSKHDFFYGINSLVNLSTGFMASCFIKRKRHFVYYDKTLQYGVVFKQMTDTMNLGDIVIDAVDHKVDFYSDGGYILMHADNELYMQEKDFALRERWGDVEIEDNPIVRICKLKNNYNSVMK